MQESVKELFVQQKGTLYRVQT